MDTHITLIFIQVEEYLINAKGLPYKIVMDLLDGLSNKGHCLYADNYFSSLQLLQDLEPKMIGFSGTLRRNAKGLHSQMRPKKDRNLAEFDSRVFKKGNTHTILWKDKDLVRFITNTTGGHVFVERRVKGRRDPQQVKKPRAIDDYNRYKFGVDLANQLESAYIFDHKSLKWWKRVVASLLEVSVVNAFIIHSEASRQSNYNVMTHLNFKKDLIYKLIRASMQTLPLNNIPLDHEIGVRNSRNCYVCNELRKKNLGERHQTKYYCTRCNKNVCPQHFILYHKQYMT